MSAKFQTGYRANVRHDETFTTFIRLRVQDNIASFSSAGRTATFGPTWDNPVSVHSPVLRQLAASTWDGCSGASSSIRRQACHRRQAVQRNPSRTQRAPHCCCPAVRACGSPEWYLLAGCTALGFTPAPYPQDFRRSTACRVVGAPHL